MKPIAEALMYIGMVVAMSWGLVSCHKISTDRYITITKAYIDAGWKTDEWGNWKKELETP